MKHRAYLYSLLARISSFPTILLLLFSAGCDDSSNPTPPENEKLIDATLVYTASAAQMKLLAQLSGFNLDINEIKYNADVYKVTYKTTYDGSDITASGLVVLPKTSDDVAMLSFHHGTITLHEDAPSNFSESDPNALLYGALSSSGFIAVIPDYLGFGSSSSILHPYYVEEYSASAVIDMLIAARELSVEKDVHFNEKLFLAGYSEGGYVTMAAHKAIETDSPEGFDLIASFPAAGAYDIVHMENYLVGLDTYDDPSYIAYTIRAYQLTYDFPNVLTDFFKEPYAGRIPSLFDGAKGTSEINSQLTSTLSDLLQEDLYDKLNLDPDYMYIKDAFFENSLIDWAPTTKMFMYHGDSDITVPYENSVNTYDALIYNGASTADLSFITLTGDHGSAIEPYILDFVPKLWALR